jgi:undecaprenyl-diphosphatase
MALLHVAVLAALQGLAETLPISRSGHQVMARMWLDEGVQARAMETVLHLGTALALVVVTRRRLLAALGDGVRAVSRPTLFQGSPSAQDALVLAVGTAVSLVASALVTPRVEMWSESPTATGVGLCVTGLGLASTALIPRPAGPLRRSRASRARGRDTQVGGPSLAGIVVLGMAVGLAAFPGASRVGAALTLLLWMGVEPERAVDLSFLLTVPALLVAFLTGSRGPSGPSTGTVALGLVLAFVASALASEMLRALAERRRVGVLALWTVPLGLAMLAYARALPLPT